MGTDTSPMQLMEGTQQLEFKRRAFRGKFSDVQQLQLTKCLYWSSPPRQTFFEQTFSCRPNCLLLKVLTSSCSDIQTLKFEILCKSISVNIECKGHHHQRKEHFRSFPAYIRPRPSDFDSVCRAIKLRVFRFWGNKKTTPSF